MAASRLKEQLEAARKETETWPAWKRKEIEAEVRKTPLRNSTKDDGSSIDGDQKSVLPPQFPKNDAISR
jgi:hypothetical protein